MTTLPAEDKNAPNSIAAVVHILAHDGVSPHVSATIVMALCEQRCLWSFTNSFPSSLQLIKGVACETRKNIGVTKKLIMLMLCLFWALTPDRRKTLRTLINCMPLPTLVHFLHGLSLSRFCITLILVLCNHLPSRAAS